MSGPRRFNSYFLVAMRLAEGPRHLLHATFSEAVATFDAVGEGGDPHATLEGLCWADVVALRLGQRGKFVRRWQALKASYPDSSGGSRASFIENSEQ